MKIEFDPAKATRNVTLGRPPFALVSEFDWNSAVVQEDVRRAYPERRFVAAGFIGPRLHVLCFTPIDGGIRIISFRKANQREVKRHAQATDG